MVRRGMTERDQNEGREGAGQGDLDMESLARDWITLWQSEFSALAHDREAAETISRLAALWAGAAAAWLRAAPVAPASGHDSPRPAASPGAAPPAAAPDAGAGALHDVLGELARRLDGIDRRLAALERGRLQPDRGRAGPGRGGTKRGR